MLLSFIVFILVLGVLVFVHELGHFLTAKWSGMRVDEFAIGFPPRLRGVKKGETLYTINLLPLGGYVKIHGENAADAEDPRSFQSRPVWQRMLVTVAGVIMNLLFAFVVLSIAFSFGFVSASQDLESVPGATVVNTQIAIVGVMPDSPAASAHLQEGDIITGFQDPQSGQDIPITSAAGLQGYTKEKQNSASRQLKVLYQRNGKDMSGLVTLSQSGPPLGVYLQPIDQVRVPVWRAPLVAVKEISYIIGATGHALADFGRQLFHARLDQDVSGPVGVYKATSSATQQGPIAVLFLMIVLSINLALLNILPIPALDGGRLLFLIIELVFRRKVVSEKIEGAVTAVGLALLLLLVAVVTVRDIINF